MLNRSNLEHNRAAPAPVIAAAPVSGPAPVTKPRAKPRRVSLLDGKQLRRLGKLIDNKQLPAIDLVVEFDYNSAQLTDKAMPVLKRLGEAMSDGRLADATFVIAGHTDAVGGRDFNKKLSLRRAFAVRDYLQQNYRLKQERLVPVGYGEERLKNHQQPGADENRRVEFVNLLDR